MAIRQLIALILGSSLMMALAWLPVAVNFHIKMTKNQSSTCVSSVFSLSEDFSFGLFKNIMSCRIMISGSFDSNPVKIQRMEKAVPMMIKAIDEEPH